MEEHDDVDLKFWEDKAQALPLEQRKPSARPPPAGSEGAGAAGVSVPCPTGVILSPRENRADGCAAVRGTCSGKSVCLLTPEQEGSSFPTHTFLVLCL